MIMDWEYEDNLEHENIDWKNEDWKMECISSDRL
jgi:hypothetical protein